jgi:NDP-sugar pyrophosphorylase family protein
MNDSGKRQIGPATVTGIVLAGSYSWQKTTFEDLRPRPLLPVAGRPLIDHVLEWLDEGRVDESIICANGATASLKRHLDVRDYHPVRIKYFEDRSPRGAAGCIRDAAQLSDAATFVVTDGASLPTADLTALLEQHRQTGATMTIVARRWRASTDAPLQVEPTGTYVLQREALTFVPATSFQDLKELLIPKLYSAGHAINVFFVDDMSPRILGAESYLALNRWKIQRMLATSPGAPAHRAQLLAHPSAEIDETAVIVGPVTIGPNARIGAHATIIGPASIGARTVVGAGAVIARSVAWENCHIGEAAVVDRSLLADGAEVQAGAVETGTLKARTPERRGLNNKGRAIVGALMPKAARQPAHIALS